MGIQYVGNKYKVIEAEDVVPSDTTAVNYTYLYVGNTAATDGTVAAGNVKLTLRNGDIATWYNCPNGKEIVADIVKVWSTGTTATNLVGGTIE